MIIETIRLANIKSFEDETLAFARGINIIAGRNGAGKSTIVESVGIALFDCWPAKFKDANARVGFIRRGQGEGSIVLTLAVEGRRFTIECNLGERRRKGKDPTTDYERILYDGDGLELSASAGRKAEFQEDIRRHILGASRIGDDKIFENIVGTAQGAFDEPFTAVESDRRQLFEKILGVEDFQRYEKQFARFVRFLSDRAAMLRSNAEVLASSAGDLELVKEELTVRTAQLSEAQAGFAVATAAREGMQKQYEDAAKKKETLEKLRDNVSRLKEHLASVQESLAHHRKELAAAVNAEAEMKKNEGGYKAYNDAESELIALRLKHEDRETAKNAYAERLRKHESVLASAEATGKGLNERLAQNKKEIAELDTEKAELEAKRVKLLEEWKSFKAEIEKLREEEQFIDRVDRYVTELLAVQKALIDSDGAIRALRDELESIEKDADVLLNGKPEVLTRATIESVRAETAELFASVITELDQHIEARDMGQLTSDVKAVLNAARESVRSAEKRQAEVKSRGESVKEEITKLGKRERDKNGELQYVLKAVQKSGAEVETENRDWTAFLAQHEKEMARFARLDESIAEAEAKKKRHKKEFDAYILVVSDAARREEREKLAKESETQEKKLRTDLDAQTKDLAKRESEYSVEAFTAMKSTFDEAKAKEQAASSLAVSSKTKVDEQQRRVDEAEKTHARYTDMLAQTARAESEHGFFATVMKEVVRGLAQRVGARIVSSVSDYADQLYARIAPEQSAKLVWDPMTYGIELHAPQAIVKGKELSGGQLMGVSLAIKLALIKWYSQSRIGFLDEPTTHLDKETRRHLSDVIMNLETIASDGAWFDQLFVISHEEALHGAGHRIELARAGGVSSVAAVD